MELPSMVERAGDRLVVRSLVSGATVYQSQLESSDKSLQAFATHPLVDTELLERQLQLLNNRSMATFAPLMMPSAQEAINAAGVNSAVTNMAGAAAAAAAAAAMGAKGLAIVGETKPCAKEELPQCKIRRNYSCNNCAFFTQNPRSHLSHLRDVHGEKIVINECKLCLYASRHFQKLVRHMKMVHGCSDDDNTGLAGRRHCNREARKRRLEESIESPAAAATASTSTAATATSTAMLQGGPTLKQLKSELHLLEQQLLHNVEAFNRQQQLQQLQQLVARSGNIFSMAFEFQLCMLPPNSSSSTTNTNTNTISSSSTTTTTSATINNSAVLHSELEREPEPSSSDSEELAQVEDCLTPEALDLSTGNSTAAAPYQCQKCSYSTPIRARFKKHVKYHSMPLIKCSSCDFHSPYKWNLDRHTKNHGANGYFKCTVCDFSTNIKQSLTIHELNHHVALRRPNAAQADQELSLEQQHQQQLYSAEQLEQHSESNETETSCDSPEADQPPISCTHCQQILPTAMDLMQHLQHCELAPRSCELELGTEDDGRANDMSYCGVETAPGYGEVTEQLQSEESDALKKVFKCPHCTFWAATASRFHVHIVGHLNRKPFECSLCSYRSNWRWDITKHIRLKTMRDKSHVQAQVLMNDETGRRNYAKYHQYLTLMKVSAEQAADAKTMRCGEMQAGRSSSSSLDQHMLVLPQAEDEEESSADALSALDLSVPSKPPLEPETFRESCSIKVKSKHRKHKSVQE